MSELRGTQIDFDGFVGYRVDPPAGVAVKGGIIVIHEIWGLVDHIKDIADRFAAEGYIAIAPDILSHGGITPEVGAELDRLRTSADEAERTRVQPLMRTKMAPVQQPEYGAWAVPALTQVVDVLAGESGVAGRIAVVGFCFGGTYSFALAAADQRVKLSLPFYGAPPQTTDYSHFSCPVRAFYGVDDERLMNGLPEVREQMSAAGVDFEAKVYDGCGHAFFNDTNSIAYNAAAAGDAWSRCLSALAGALS